MLVMDGCEKRNECVFINDLRMTTEITSEAGTVKKRGRMYRKQNVEFIEILVNGWPHILVCRSVGIEYCC